MEGQLCFKISFDINRMLWSRLKKKGVVLSEEMKYDLQEESDRHIFVFDGRHLSNQSNISTVYTFMWFGYMTNFEIRKMLLPPILHYYKDLHLYFVGNDSISWIIDKIL